MKSIRTFMQRLSTYPWLPYVLTAFGGIVYVIHAGIIAHTKTSFLDEGLYLYKGLLFATGEYLPFQDYGPWTNKMPLAFLIPGYIQKWFGPGLLTGRYFMIFLSMLTLVGLWLLTRRWGGKWWATGVIWVMALNPAEIKLHTLALTQGLIAFMLVWSLALTVGIKRPLWQILLGSALSALAILIRIDMAFVLPLLLLYIFWQHGPKNGFLALLVGGLVVAVGHALYWPDILKIWVVWLPAEWTPFLDPWRIPPAAAGTFLEPTEPRNAYTVFLYFWLTLRLHFVALFSALMTWLLWPRRKGKPVTSRVRAAILISTLLVVLWVAHASVTIVKEYCVSCILLYVAYFDFLGLALLPIAYRFLQKESSRRQQALIFLVIVLIVAGVGFSTYEDVSSALAKPLIERLRDTYLWGLLGNLTGLSALLLFRRVVTVLGSLLAVILLAGLLLLTRRLLPDKQAWVKRAGVTTLNLILIIGLVLTPTTVLGKGNDFFDCDGSNVLESYERAGEYLRNVIPQGSKVYWDGRILAIFLYVPDVVVYPPQMNHSHSYYLGGDAETLLRFGRWNDALARQWLTEADYVLLEKGLIQDWVIQVLESGGYVKLESTRKVERCRWQSIIDIYQRVEP